MLVVPPVSSEVHWDFFVSHVEAKEKLYGFLASRLYQIVDLSKNLKEIRTMSEGCCRITDTINPRSHGFVHFTRISGSIRFYLLVTRVFQSLNLLGNSRIPRKFLLANYHGWIFLIASWNAINKQTYDGEHDLLGICKFHGEVVILITSRERAISKSW